MSVRTIRSPLPTSSSSSSSSGQDSFHRAHSRSYLKSNYGSKTSRFNREATSYTGARPLPRGPGPLDDKGRKLKGTDYNANYSLTSSSFRPKKSSLPSMLGSINQPLRATHSSDVSSYYKCNSRETSPKYGGLSRTSGISHRSRSISDLSRNVRDRLQLGEEEDSSSHITTAAGYKESSFGNVSDRIERSKLISINTNNSPVTSYKYSNQIGHSPTARLSRQDSYSPSGSQTPDYVPHRNNRSRSSSRTRKLNRSSSLLSPLNVRYVTLFIVFLSICNLKYSNCITV